MQGVSPLTSGHPLFTPGRLPVITGELHSVGRLRVPQRYAVQVVGLRSHCPCLEAQEGRKGLATASWALLLQVKSAALSTNLKPSALTQVDVSLPVLPRLAVGTLDEG